MRLKRNTSIGISGVYINAIIDELDQEGMKIINKAFKTKTTQNITYNEKNAYVYGVFYKGSLVRYGFLDGRGAIEAHPKINNSNETFWGRDEAFKAITDFRPKENRGFELVCLVATFYSAINEEKPKYRVISQSISDLDMLKSKYKGSSVRIINSYNGQL